MKPRVRQEVTFAVELNKMLSYKCTRLFPFRRLQWQLRTFSSAVQGQQTCLALVYSKFGQPENVVRYVRVTMYLI